MPVVVVVVVAATMLVPVCVGVRQLVVQCASAVVQCASAVCSVRRTTSFVYQGSSPSGWPWPVSIRMAR